MFRSAASVLRIVGLLLLCSVLTVSARRVLGKAKSSISQDELNQNAASSQHGLTDSAQASENTQKAGLLKVLAVLLLSGQTSAFAAGNRPLPISGNRGVRPLGNVSPVVHGRSRLTGLSSNGGHEYGGPSLDDHSSGDMGKWSTPLFDDIWSQEFGKGKRDGRGMIELANGTIDTQNITGSLGSSSFRDPTGKRRGRGLIEALDVDFENAVSALKADIPNLLQRLPDWSNFENDFKIIDHHGNYLEGMTQNSCLLKLLRRVKRKLVLKDDVQVRLMHDTSGYPMDSFLTARWEVQLGGSEFSFLRFWQIGKEEKPVDIEVETSFHLNENNKVDYVRVNKWLVNGRECEGWPDIELTDGTATNFQKIKEWVQDSLPDLRPWWTDHAGYLSHIEEIGSGNFAKVFSMDLTCPPNLEATKIAMKELLPDMMDQTLIRGEIKAMEDLSEFLLKDGASRKEIIGTAEDYSPYCAPLLAKPRVQDGRMYLPMPFANKGTFKDIYEDPIKRELYGGDKGMYGMLLHIAKGVKALNGAGYVHNDLHGENALITCTSDEIDPANSYASLVDLGLATRRDSHTAGIRGKGKIISPEMMRMRNSLHYPIVKSDVWSLGTILWEVALGSDTLPTLGASGASIEEIENILSDLDFKNERFQSLDGQPEIQELLRGMLTQDCAERWDIDKVIEKLERVAHPEMKGQHPSPFRKAGVSPGELASPDHEPKIARGVKVEITGMISSKSVHLNGDIAEIVDHVDEIKGYELRLKDGNVIRVRSQNVRLVHMH